jgi:hypothetical protein
MDVDGDAPRAITVNFNFQNANPVPRPAPAPAALVPQRLQVQVPQFSASFAHGPLSLLYVVVTPDVAAPWRAEDV